MSIFYLPNEPYVAVLAPTNGEVLPFDESSCKLEEADGLSISVASDTVVSPINGALLAIHKDHLEIIGECGEILRLQSNIPFNTDKSIGAPLCVGDILFHFERSAIAPIITLSLNNSDEFRAITVFEGPCYASKTEIMSFCK